mgnify:CR=1 FL=1|tara:strand:+ start:682 stop:900 length:219 start_codon:yes stop_codon:yes gene_type:complete
MVELLRASSKGPEFFHARSFVLRQNLLTDFSMDVGEAKVSALEAVGKLFMVEAEEMEEGRVEVVFVSNPTTR